MVTRIFQTTFFSKCNNYVWKGIHFQNQYMFWKCLSLQMPKSRKQWTYLISITDSGIHNFSLNHIAMYKLINEVKKGMCISNVVYYYPYVGGDVYLAPSYDNSFDIKRKVETKKSSNWWQTRFECKTKISSNIWIEKESHFFYLHDHCLALFLPSWSISNETHPPNKKYSN